MKVWIFTRFTDFWKLGNKKIRIEFGDNLPKQLFEKIVERCIYSSEKGGMGFKYEMKTHLKEYTTPFEYGYVDGKDEIKSPGIAHFNMIFSVTFLEW